MCAGTLAIILVSVAIDCMVSCAVLHLNVSANIRAWVPTFTFAMSFPVIITSISLGFGGAGGSTTKCVLQVWVGVTVCEATNFEDTRATAIDRICPSTTHADATPPIRDLGIYAGGCRVIIVAVAPAVLPAALLECDELVAFAGIHAALGCIAIVLRPEL